MTALEQIRKVYQEAQKNNFWDAWGIVASPQTIHELRAECLEQVVVYNVSRGMINSIFGLVLIPCVKVETDKIYVADEKLGRMILGEGFDERNR